MKARIGLSMLAAPLIGTAALVIGTAALADDVQGDDIQKATDRAQAEFKALDRDADARISQSEARANSRLARRFAAVDANADGFLSAEEYMARPSDESFE
jgi:hypothetical protein